jgi:RNA polymerase sigma factor (sigma-70 family)
VRRLGATAQRDRNRLRRKPPEKVLGVGSWREDFGKRPGGGTEPPSNDPSPSRWARTAEGAARVRAAIEGIQDESCRTILRMRYLEGLPLKEIAEKLGLSYKQVRTRYWSTLDHLKHDLKGLL